MTIDTYIIWFVKLSTHKLYYFNDLFCARILCTYTFQFPCVIRYLYIYIILSTIEYKWYYIQTYNMSIPYVVSNISTFFSSPRSNIIRLHFTQTSYYDIYHLCKIIRSLSVCQIVALERKMCARAIKLWNE